LNTASIIFSGRDWLVPTLVMLGVLLALMGWSYRGSIADTRIRVACFFLKLLGLLALGFCLLEPLWSGQRVKPGANHFVIVADNSQGLQIRDNGKSQTRGEFLRDLVNGDKSPWQGKIDDNFQVGRYFFDARLQSTKDFSELVFDGRSSAIGTALKTIKERFANRPLAGILLLTDGNATDMTGAGPDLAGLPPVYPVVIGSDDPIKDIAIENVTVNQTAFEDAPVTVQADVMANGYFGAALVAQLLNDSGRVVESQDQRVVKDGQPVAFRFQLKPEKAGLTFYRLRVSARSELGQFLDPKTSVEATLANNTRVILADRGHGPYRILYVAGRPNWEFKFLNRALSEDDQVQLVAMIRIAKREPKFDFRGRAGESSNPLYRGFGNQSKEEVERYDQPVIIRLNTTDAAELSGGFPKKPEDLYAYHAIILDDVEAEFFTGDQMLLLQKFVSERGGGFMMLGGMECFAQGKYQRTPIADILPVYLDRGTDGPQPDQVRMQLTREGWLQPWARLRSNEGDERARIDNMPPFLVFNQIHAVKPGASIIASVVDSSGKQYPALVTQRFGRGRTAALTIGDLWHWGLHDAEAHKDLDKAWRQMARWLVADVPNRVELAAEPRRDGNQSMQLQVRVRDAQFQAFDNAVVTLKVRPTMTESSTTGSTNEIVMRAEPSLSEAGLYEATYVPHDTGGYMVTAFVTNSVGAEVGRADTGWTTDLAAEEFRSLKPNRALLETIAKQTGGEVIAAGKLADFAASLPNRKAPVTESWTYPLWHTPLIFAFALACFIAEWGLRRFRGLA
jgi:uncharacterized membrane protein